MPMCYGWRTAVSLQTRIMGFLLQVAQLFHQLRWLKPGVTAQGGFQTTLLLWFCREGANLRCIFGTTTADFIPPAISKCEFEAMPAPEKQFSTLTTGLHPQWAVSTKEAATAQSWSVKLFLNNMMALLEETSIYDQQE